MLYELAHRVVAWLVGSVSAYVLASVSHTQIILGELTSLGVVIPPATRLSTTATDLVGLYAYGLVIALAFALGLIIMHLAGKRLPALPRHMLAGALTIAVSLIAMRVAFSFTPLASAREWLGFGLHCLAGAAGGFVFSYIAGRQPAADTSTPRNESAGSSTNLER